MSYTSKMSDEQQFNKSLTELLEDAGEISLDTIDMEAPLEAPVRRAEDVLYSARLSPATMKAEERRLARLERKRLSLRNRKKYTRKRGHVHPKKKEATRRRQLAKRWAESPFFCVVRNNPFAAKAFDKEMWDKHIQPLWEKYDPADLEVVHYRRDDMGRDVGTRANPRTTFTMDVRHKKTGQILYKGSDLLLYYLSM